MNWDMTQATGGGESGVGGGTQTQLSAMHLRKGWGGIPFLISRYKDWARQVTGGQT